jgi:hypothetical protein
MFLFVTINMIKQEFTLVLSIILVAFLLHQFLAYIIALDELKIAELLLDITTRGHSSTYLTKINHNYTFLLLEFFALFCVLANYNYF